MNFEPHKECIYLQALTFQEISGFGVGMHAHVRAGWDAWALGGGLKFQVPFQGCCEISLKFHEISEICEIC